MVCWGLISFLLVFQLHLSFSIYVIWFLKLLVFKNVSFFLFPLKVVLFPRSPSSAFSDHCVKVFIMFLVSVLQKQPWLPFQVHTCCPASSLFSPLSAELSGISAATFVFNNKSGSLLSGKPRNSHTRLYFQQVSSILLSLFLTYIHTHTVCRPFSNSYHRSSYFLQQYSLSYR